VTNQACVGRGVLSTSELDRINTELGRLLEGRISGWYVCPHASDAGCSCRKPGTGLLEQAAEAWSFEPGVTWLVADDVRDVEAARRFGCRPALVRTGKGAATAEHCRDVPAFDDLEAFARALIEAGDRR